MIRQAVASDEAAIRGCAEQAYSQYIPLIGKRPAPMLADFAAQIAAGEIFVASDGQGELLGYIGFYPEDGAMLLDSVAVLPRTVGQGIGKKLIAFCEETARQRGLASVRLYTNAKMIANHAIYPRLGYVETGRRHEDGYDRIYYEKVLV